MPVFFPSEDPLILFLLLELTSGVGWQFGNVSHTYTYQFCNRNDANWSNPVQLTRERLLHFVEKVQLLCAKKMAALVATIDYVNTEFLKDTIFWMMIWYSLTCLLLPAIQSFAYSSRASLVSMYSLIPCW